MQLRTRLLSGVATAITCALALLLSTFAASAHATGKGQQVYWAGYAFTGDQASMAATAPHSARVLNAVGLETINQVLSRNLRQQPPKYIELIEDPVAMLDGSTSATVLAAALDRELVSVEPIGHQYKLLVIELRQQVASAGSANHIAAAEPASSSPSTRPERAKKPKAQSTPPASSEDPNW